MNSCSICLEEVTIENIVKPCKQSDKHVFCKSCIEDWIRTFENNDNEYNYHHNSNINYFILKDEHDKCALCPVCRGEIIQLTNTEIYDMYGNLISIVEYMNNVNNCTQFKIKKYKNKRRNELKYEYIIAPFSIKNQLHYPTPIDSNFSLNTYFSLSTLKNPHIILNGLFIEYYENGNIKVRKEMKNNAQHGLYEEFYQDNSVKVITTYVQNKLHGSYTSYYENGNLEINAYFDNDNVVGNYEKYFHNGTLNIKAFYILDFNRTNNSKSTFGLNISNNINIDIGSNEHSFLENIFIQYKLITKKDSTIHYLAKYEVYKNTILTSSYEFTDVSIIGLRMIVNTNNNNIYLLKKIEVSENQEENENKNTLYRSILYNSDNKIVKNYTYYIDSEFNQILHGNYLETSSTFIKSHFKIYKDGKIIEEREYLKKDKNSDIDNNLSYIKFYDYTKNIVNVKCYINNIIVLKYTHKIDNEGIRVGIEYKYNDYGLIIYKKYHYSKFYVMKNFKIIDNKSILDNINIYSNNYIKNIFYGIKGNIIREELKKLNNIFYSKDYYENGNIKNISHNNYINEDINITIICNYSENGKRINYTYAINNILVAKDNKYVTYKHKPQLDYLDGTYKLCTQLNTKNFIKVTFKKNKLNGKYIKNEFSTRIKKKYKNNRLHGISKKYTYDMMKKIFYTSYSIQYKDGLKNGLCKTYSSNGKLISKSYYKNDLLHGLHKEYLHNILNDTTKLVKTMYYENNILHGTFKDYSDYGIYTKNYTHGKVDGICQFISKNDIIETKYFKNNIPINLHTIIDTKNNETLLKCNYDISEEEIGTYMDIDNIDYTKYVYGICEKYIKNWDSSDPNSNPNNLTSLNIDLKVSFLILIDKSKLNNKNSDINSRFNNYDEYMYIHGIVNILNGKTNAIIGELNFNLGKLCDTFDVYYENGNKHISTYIENSKIVKYFDYYEENGTKLLSFNDENDLIEANKYIHLNNYTFFDVCLDYFNLLSVYSLLHSNIHYYSTNEHLTQEEYDALYPQSDNGDDHDDDSYGYDYYSD